jgi:hypothetical protein
VVKEAAARLAEARVAQAVEEEEEVKSEHYMMKLKLI